MDFQKILDEAHKAAFDAQKGLFEGTGSDCGFAWVVIPGNSPLAIFCRKQLKSWMPGVMEARCSYQEAQRRYGSKTYPIGWQWWKPGGSGSQTIGVHEAGARAFRDSLAEHEIVAEVRSRLD